MKKHYIVTLLTLVSLQTFGQGELKKYINENTNSIQSIQPDAIDFSDLEVIGNAIGDARIVMLGEQHHGDGATFLAKSRLIKYLHEMKGFTVLAFENDFFALNEGWDKVEKEQEQIKTFLKDNVYAIWSDSKQCSDLLYNHIPSTHQTSTPLTVTGFDTQMTMDHSPRNLQKFVHAYLKEKNIPFTKTKEYQLEFMPAIGKLTKGQLLKGKEAELATLEGHAQTVLQQLSEYKKDFEWLLIKNIYSFALITRIASDVPKAYQVRDQQMADNLQWLLKEKFPNEKVIVWAANAHLYKNAKTAFKFKRTQWDWMGTVFTQDSINAASTYVLGFSSKTGMHQNVHQPAPIKVSKPLKKGFENWIDEKHNYAFIDFKRFRKENPTFSGFFAMKGAGHSSDIADWTKVFDGVFFIKEMTPSDKKEDLSSTKPLR